MSYTRQFFIDIGLERKGDKETVFSEALIFLSTLPRLPLRVGKYSHRARIAAGSPET